MDFTSIRNAVTSRMGGQILQARKHSPVILFAAGVVGISATIVMASRATLRAQSVMEKHKHAVETASALYNDPQYNDLKQGEQYTSKDYKRDLAVIYTGTLVNLTKMYGPALVLGLASVAALTGSHIVLTKRYAGATAAYAAMHKGFQEYRKRVLDQYGEDKDNELRYGLVDKTIVEETAQGPVTKTIKALDNKNVSIYARVFDKASSKSWQREHGYNQFFIQCQQNYANDLLKARGHVFLNEVYDMLGLDRTSAGQLVGWVLGDCGDGYIDFGVFSGDRYMGQEFVNGNERSIVLDFNVTGVVYDQI